LAETTGMEADAVRGGEEAGTRVADALPVALTSLPLFGGLGAEASAALEQELEWLSLLGGHSLFDEGDPSDALYVVISGVLGVVAGEGRARGSLLAQIHPGETVGEMAMLSDRLRSATIIALRDSTLLRIAKASFARVMETHPSSMRYLSQLLVDRLDRTTHRTKAAFAARTLALIPLEAGLAIERFAADLAGALRDAGTSTEILDTRARVAGLDALHALEKLHQLVIYRGDWQDAAWTRLCIRHADHILLLARASSGAERTPPAWGIADLKWRLCELVLLQEEEAPAPAPAAPWLARSAARAHYHLRVGNKGDFARLGRYIRGRAVGLVLSGGGARGYGHLGVVKALRRAGVPLDLVGGTSFGAIVAAGIACEWDDRELSARVHDAFVRSDPLRDYTFPFVALTRGREVARRLRQHFGENRIEDLWRPYFAVATNLTTGEVAVERDGPLWQALLASSAIPGLVPPVIRRGEVLVDGAVMNNLPVDIMSTMRRGPIIAVDVARYLNLRPTAPVRFRWLRRLMAGEETVGLGIVSLLLSSAATASDAQARLCRELADLLLEPPLREIGLRDWKSFDRAIEDAYRYTMTRIEEIERRCRGVAP